MDTDQILIQKKIDLNNARLAQIDANMAVSDAQSALTRYQTEQQIVAQTTQLNTLKGQPVQVLQA